LARHLLLQFNGPPRLDDVADGVEHYFLAAQGLPDFGAQGWAAFLSFGPQGLDILPDLGAQGLEPWAAAGAGEAAIMPLTAAIVPSVCSVFLKFAIDLSLGLKNRRAS
jgi:hypothetical protein